MELNWARRILTSFASCPGISKSAVWINSQTLLQTFGYAMSKTKKALKQTSTAPRREGCSRAVPLMTTKAWEHWCPSPNMSTKGYSVGAFVRYSARLVPTCKKNKTKGSCLNRSGTCNSNSNITRVVMIYVLCLSLIIRKKNKFRYKSL